MKTYWGGLLVVLTVIFSTAGHLSAQSFQPNLRVDDTGNNVITQTEPAIVLDDTGNIYLVWTDERNGHPDIFFAKSTDKGLSFSPNIKVNTANFTAQKPSLALDGTNDILVVWTDERNGNPDIYFAKSTDGGASFSANVRVDDTGISGSTQSAPVIGVHPGSGSIYVAWIDEREGVKHIYFAKSINGGTSFNANIKIDDAASITPNNVALAVDDNDRIYLVWKDERNGTKDIFFDKSINGGSNFNADVKVNDVSSASDFPKIAVDSEGNIYTTWTDDRDGHPHIYFAKSPDGGVSFSANLRVDDSGLTASDQFGPNISIDQRNIYVIWSDNRNGNPDIYLAQSITGTPNFGANIRIDDTGTATAIQTAPVVAVDTSGYLYAAWSDNRRGLGDPDIYFATTYPLPARPLTPNPSGDELTTGSSGAGSGSDWRCFIATAAYGTPLAKEVVTLRHFRDNYLLTNPLGRRLVDIYYKLSPPIAQIISKSELLRRVVRRGLQPLIDFARLTIDNKKD